MSSVLDAVSPLHESLDYHLARHTLLSSNLAHVDTPGYRSRELVRTGHKVTFDGQLELQMRATNDLHMSNDPGPAPGERAWQVARDPYSPVGPDGNAVSLDREAVKIAANNLRYDAVSTLIQGQLQALTWAANDGR